METLVSHCQLPFESDLPIHGSINCPDVIDEEPIDIVVDPLIIPPTTISLFEDVSIEFITAGFAAVPDADQSFEFLGEKFIDLSIEKSSSWLEIESPFAGDKPANKSDENNNVIINKFNDFAMRMAKTVHTVSKEGHETFPLSVIISLYVGVER